MTIDEQLALMSADDLFDAVASMEPGFLACAKLTPAKAVKLLIIMNVESNILDAGDSIPPSKQVDLMRIVHAAKRAFMDEAGVAMPQDEIDDMSALFAIFPRVRGPVS
jgi:hypothetical protein